MRELWTTARRSVLRNGELATGAVWAFALTLSGSGLGFLNHTLLSRSLGVSEYGLYTVALAAMNMALILVKFDFDSAAPRFIGGYLGTNEPARARRYVAFAARWVVLAGLAAVGVTALFVLLRSDSLEQRESRTFLLASVLLVTTALLALWQSALQGVKATLAAQSPANLLRPLIFLVLIASIAALGYPRQADVAVAANLASSLCALAVLAFAWRRLAPKGDEGLPLPATEPRLWWTTAAGFLSIGLSQLILSGTTDIVVIGLILDTAEAGRYSIASQLSGLIMLPVNAVALVATPMIARHFHAKEGVELQRMLTFTSRATLVLALPGILLLVFAGVPILGLFGPGFAVGYPILFVSSLSCIQGAAGGAIAGYVLTMTGRQKEASRIIFTSCILYLVLAAPATYFFGGAGTAAATLAAYLLRTTLLVRTIHKELGLSIMPFPRRAVVSIS